MAQSTLPRQEDWYTYTADDATDYSCEVNCSIAAIAALAWGAFDANAPVIPKLLKPRYIYVRHVATGRTRKVIVGSTAADAWTGVASSITMAEKADADGEPWVIMSRHGEAETFKLNRHP